MKTLKASSPKGRTGFPLKVGLALAGVLLLPPVCHAAERWIGLEVGTSDVHRSDSKSVDARRFNLSGRLSLARWASSRWALLPFGEVTAGAIRTWGAGNGQNLRINEGGARLVFQLRYRPGRRLFLEAGSGPMVFSDKGIGDLNLGGKLQFRSYIGLGVRLGAQRRWQLSYRYSHTSNANISPPNPGINFLSGYLSYSF